VDLDAAVVEQLNGKLGALFAACRPDWRVGVIAVFPGMGESPTFPQVRLGCPSLWSAISGISALAGRVSGAGLWWRFSNFRFGGAETGSTADRDWFAECLRVIPDLNYLHTASPEQGARNKRFRDNHKGKSIS
jgi:hypothetical protein